MWHLVFLMPVVAFITMNVLMWRWQNELRRWEKDLMKYSRQLLEDHDDFEREIKRHRNSEGEEWKDV